MNRIVRSVRCVVLALASLASCGADELDSPIDRPRSADGGAGGVEGGGGADPGSLGPGGGGGPSGTARCSSDLHSLIDESGRVLKTCPPDQGCAAGACVPACESARANKSTIGCDYYNFDLTSRSGILESISPCFAAFVVNTWTAPVTIGLEVAGRQMSMNQVARIPSGTGRSIVYRELVNGQLPPNEVAILFLMGAPGSCPAGVTPASTTPLGLTGTGRAQAFHITTSAPVVAYDIFPYGGGASAATSASLLLPTSAWGTNYIAVDPYQGMNEGIEMLLDVVAMEDGTTVTVLPKKAIPGGGGVDPAPAGSPKTYTLARGEVLQLSHTQEITGSPIASDKPVGVWGATPCFQVPVGKAACDSGHQQIPPVNALGHEYVAVRYRNRYDGVDESPPWRLVGAVDGTTLTYEPAAPSGAPSTLAAGANIEFRAAGPFVVRSQDDKHPFYLAGYMTGAQDVQTPQNDGRGDPEFVNVIPSQQYLTSYVFFADPTYPETNLVVVRKKAQDGAFKAVTLDCAGPLGGFQPLGGSSNYEYTRVDLVRHDFQKQGNCDNGRHDMRSDAPFGLTVWGWGSSESGGSATGGAVPGASGFFSQYVSYAYPAGASVQPINDVVVSPTIK